MTKEWINDFLFDLSI